MGGWRTTPQTSLSALADNAPTPVCRDNSADKFEPAGCVAPNGCEGFLAQLVRKKRNYVGRVTLPTSIKEKEARWLIKSREPPPPQKKKDETNVDLEGY
eukprot:1138926-Pelagomonas_calceolata.AAC.12